MFCSQQLVIATAALCAVIAASSDPLKNGQESLQPAETIDVETSGLGPEQKEDQQDRDLYNYGYSSGGKRGNDYFRYFYHSPVAPPGPYYHDDYYHDDYYHDDYYYDDYFYAYARGGKKSGGGGKKGKKKAKGGKRKSDYSGKKGYPYYTAPTYSHHYSPVAAPGVHPYVECSDLIPCQFPGRVCDSGTCVIEGALRFTLRWEGDDDLDLHVRTPNEFTIAFGNSPDPVTGGTFEDDAQGSSHNHKFYVESVFFPSVNATDGLNGTYTLTATQFTKGYADDFFSIAAYLNGVLRTEFFGVFRGRQGHSSQSEQRFQFTVF